MPDVAGIFMGVPERWMDWQHRWRCQNGHVRGMVIKSEALGRDACPSCFGVVLFTFPEDEEGNQVGAEVFALRWWYWVAAHPEYEHVA